MTKYLIALLLLSSVAWGGSFTIYGFDNAGYDCDATFLDEAQPTTILGSATTILVGASGVDEDARPCIRFPTLDDSMRVYGEYGVTWDSAMVCLTTHSSITLGATDTISVTLHKLTNAFVETQATWNDYATATAWTTAGGDYNATRLTNANHPDSMLLIGGDLSTNSPLCWYIDGSDLSDSLETGLILTGSYASEVEAQLLMHSDDASILKYKPTIRVWYSGGTLGIETVRQDDIEDTFLKKNASGDNFGTNEELNVNGAILDSYVSLLRISDFPASLTGVELDSVTLSFYGVAFFDNTSDLNLYYCMKDNWTEQFALFTTNGATWIDWDERFGGGGSPQAWGTPGATNTGCTPNSSDGSGHDMCLTDGYTIDIGTGLYNWYTIYVDPTQVERWIANPTTANGGIILEPDGTDLDLSIRSSDYTTDTTLTPFFTFFYTVEEDEATGKIIIIN